MLKIKEDNNANGFPFDVMGITTFWILIWTRCSRICMNIADLWMDLCIYAGYVLVCPLISPADLPYPSEWIRSQFVFAAFNSLSIWHTSCNRSFNNGILLVGSVLGSALCGILSRVERWHILLVCIMVLFFVCHLYKDNWTVNYCSYFLSLPGNVTLNSPFRFRAS